MDTFVKKLSEHCGNVRGEVLRLRRLADSFWATGNDRMSVELTEMADALDGYQKEIYGAYDEHLNQQVRASQETLGNVLRACADVADRQGQCKENDGTGIQGVGSDLMRE